MRLLSMDTGSSIKWLNLQDSLGRTEISPSISEWLRGRTWGSLKECGVQWQRATEGVSTVSFWKLEFYPDFWRVVDFSSFAFSSVDKVLFLLSGARISTCAALRHSPPPPKFAPVIIFLFSSFQLLPLSWLFSLSVWICLSQLHLKNHPSFAKTGMIAEAMWWIQGGSL